MVYKKDDVLKHSQSGGAFTALSDVVLQQGGIIYGCILNEKFEAVHVRADNIQGRNAMRGSKYIQSEIEKTYKCVKKDLEEGKTVLFTGTPCQIAALKNYVPHEYMGNLYLVDIICHGVASPAVWQDYLKWMSNKIGKIDRANFRNKQYGWDHAVETYESNGYTHKSYVFLKLFFMHRIVRDSCYQCPYKNLERQGDLTIGDFWGIHKVKPFVKDKQGVSLVLANTPKGLKLVSQIDEDKVLIIETPLEQSLQPTLKENYEHRMDEHIFWDEYANKDFTYIAKKYGAYSLKGRIRRVVVDQIKALKSFMDHIYFRVSREKNNG